MLYDVPLHGPYPQEILNHPMDGVIYALTVRKLDVLRVPLADMQLTSGGPQSKAQRVQSQTNDACSSCILLLNA